MPRPRASTLWRTQNFLHDPDLIERLVAQAALRPNDVVYDLGAGSGNLTAALARRVMRVIAIEKDPALVRRLRRRFAHASNVIVREADILAHALPRRDYTVVASPPFDITAAVVRAVTAAPVPPRDAYFVLQREAAARFAGRPRTTLSAALLGPWFAVDVLHRFAPSDFVPRPSVDTVFVRLHKRGPPLVPDGDRQLYRDFVVVAFTSRRATVGEALSETLGSPATRAITRAAAVEGRARPSDLALERRLDLYRAFARAPGAIRSRVAGSEARLRRRNSRLQKPHHTRTPRDALAGARKDSERPYCGQLLDRAL